METIRPGVIYDANGHRYFPPIVPVKDEFYGRLEDGIAHVATKPEGLFQQAWEVEKHPQPVLQMRQERPASTDGRS